MVIHGNAMYWQSMAVHGNEWQRMATQGELWQSMTIHGNESQAIYGNVAECSGKRAGAYPMDAELSRYLYPHWSRKGMKHLCCWKPPCACTAPPMDLAIGH